MKYSTAKTIWRNYKTTGQIEKKRRHGSRTQTTGTVTAGSPTCRALPAPMVSDPALNWCVVPTHKYLGPNFWADRLASHFSSN